MVVIHSGLCDGCGACVEICPSGALYLVEQRTVVDPALCAGCEACVTACPTGAIVPAAREGPAGEPVNAPAVRPEAEVIRVRTSPAPQRSRAWPLWGAAVIWAGREILPRLADFVLDTLDRRATRPLPTDVMPRRETTTLDVAKDEGRQRRRRHRGGSG